MKTESYPAADLKIFAGLGVVAIIGLILLPLIGLGYVIKETGRIQDCVGRSASDPGCAPGPLWEFLGKDSAPVETQPPAEGSKPAPSALGGEGSVCGGPDRLPCMPGLGCQKQDGDVYGICMKAEVDATVKTRNIGDACGNAIGPCAAGAVCKLSPGVAMGVCINAGSASPRIASLSLKGMALDQGWYVADAGTDVEIIVNAVNAVAVRANLIPFNAEPAGARTALAELKRAEGGKFTGSFTVSASLKAGLEIIATSKDGQEAAMSVNVEAK